MSKTQIGMKYCTSLGDAEHSRIAQCLSEITECPRQREICKPDLALSKALNMVPHGMLRCKIHD